MSPRRALQAGPASPGCSTAWGEVAAAGGWQFRYWSSQWEGWLSHSPRTFPEWGRRQPTCGSINRILRTQFWSWRPAASLGQDEASDLGPSQAAGFQCSPHALCAHQASPWS